MVKNKRSKRQTLLLRVLFVLFVAAFVSVLHDAVLDVMQKSSDFVSLSFGLGGAKDVNPNRLPPLCETKTLSVLREDLFKAKPGWRTQCSEKFKKQMQVSSRFHYQRRRDEEGRAIKKVKFEEVLVSLPPVGKLKELEQYAYEGKDFGAFDDTDKAVGRKAISILFSGRDGFIDEQLARFRYCQIVVVTASFGAQDTLHRPIGADPTRYKQDDVCFVAFVDKPTIEKFGYQSGRMKARLVKALLPFHFPESKVTVWVDSKLELSEDATAVVDVLLRANTHPKITRVKRHERPYEFDVAVSENHVREDVFAEADKLTKMFHGALSVNETYDSDRSRWLSQTVKRYKEEGFQGKGLPDTGVVHSKDECDWVRVKRQISFPYVKWIMEQRGFGDRIRVFEKCWYIAAVNEVGHARLDPERLYWY
ncbi:unnamed protein product [Bathycoccus prasinos]